MKTHRFPLFAVAIALSLSVSARATVLVYEGFHPEDYNNVAAGADVAAGDIAFTPGHTIGIASEMWNKMGGTQIRVFGANRGLALPSVMTAAGFTAHGGSIGCNPASNNTDMRAMHHTLLPDTLKASAGTTLYVRMLLNVDATAAGKLTGVSAPPTGTSGNYYGCGFCVAPGDSEYRLLTRQNSAFAFAIWKDSGHANQLVLSFTHTTSSGTTATFLPVVEGVTAGETYLCCAEIQIDAGTDGKEIIRVGAVAASSFTGAVPWAQIGGDSDSVEVDLFTDSSFPNTMAVGGPYGSNKGYFRADEIVVGTAKADIIPAVGVFAVAVSGVPTIGQTSFSTDWILAADDGVTADAGLVYSTDETFATATTNALGTGLSDGTRTASLAALEPGVTYWWKIYADNGSDVAETTPASFTTLGAPILGAATATPDGETATFSVALAEAALGNTLSTSVSVFYGTDGENWTELPLGSVSAPETFQGTANSLGYGVTYQWFARASATMQGGRVLSANSATKPFTTLFGGDMYVNAGSENATPPYKTSATAARNIPEALALATDGATIHVAPGLYKISTPLNVTSAVRILGDDPDPSRVIVSNTVGAGSNNGNHRVLYVNNAGAVVANVTLKGGSGWGRTSSGCGFAIGTSGGMVSNCVVEACMTKGNQAMAGGAQLEGGCVTHTVFRKCKVGSDTTSNKNQGMSYEPGVLRLTKYSKAENCLFVDNTQEAGKALTLIRLEDNATLRNCTVVDSGLGNTNQYCAVFTPVYLTSANATVQNVVVAGVTNRIDGALCRPVWGRPAKFLNGATDAAIAELGFPEGTVVGTAEAFFKDYANGDYRPKAGGPLTGKGVNYEGMASVDLAGDPRLVGQNVDIGAYEAPPSGTLIILQ